MADMTQTQIKSALLYKKQEIVALIGDKGSSLNLRLRLWQCGILTEDERSSLGDTCDREGPLGQAGQLVDTVLTRQDQLQGFLDELQTLCVEAHTVLVDNADVLERISSHIGATYKSRNCHKVQALPGEKLHLDLHRVEYVMPIVIEAKKIVRSERQGHWLSETELRHDYRTVDIASIEGVLNAMHEEHESVVLCLGIAGVGKTICAKTILTHWVDRERDLPFKIVIVIPVRDVNINSSIVDIIGEGNLGLISDTMQKTMEFFLQEESIASKILIIIDGIDEKDIPTSSEMYPFITGQKCPHVKKMITARPEAALLSQLLHFYPGYKITVLGTSREGVYGYLRAVMTDDNKRPTDDEVHSLIEKCEHEMIEFDLLLTPLYLTLVGFIFNHHWAQHCKFSNFIIPKTMTNLFTSFITILIRTWLKKIGRIQQFKDETIITFQNNPVGTDSNIPNDIKRVLIFFGKLSYDFIEKQQFNFTENDLKKYFIDVEDIKQSGMFCISTEQGHLQCFYRHKTLQEYMAALYLSHFQFESESFSKYTLPERVSSQKFLFAIFSNLYTVLKFVFGMEPKFGCKIIQKLQGHLSVFNIKFSVLPAIDIRISTEASLYKEIEDPGLSQAMLDLLTQTRVQEIDIRSYNSFECPSFIVHALCQAFSPTQAHTLLKNWFGLNVYQRGQDWGISDTNCLDIYLLSHKLYVLALKHQYHHVQRLSVTDTEISDISLLLRLFPKLKYLNIGIPGDVGCSHCESLATSNIYDIANNASLTHVNVGTGSDLIKVLNMIIPASLCQSLMLLSGLQSLRMFGSLHPLCEAVAIGPVFWGKLTELELYIRDTNEQNVIALIETSMLLLKDHTPQLQAFTLGSDHLYHIGTAKVLEALSTTPLPALTTLRLFGVLDSEGVLALCDCLPPGVHTLGLGWGELVGIAGHFMHKVIHGCPVVKDLHIGWEENVHNTGFLILSVLFKLISHRPSDSIPPHIQVGLYNYYDQKYVSEFELLHSHTSHGNS